MQRNGSPVLRKRILGRLADQILAEQRAVAVVISSARWQNAETQMAFVDVLFDSRDLPKLVEELQDDNVDHLAEVIAHDLEMGGQDGCFNLHRLVLSRVDWKQVAARLLEWAGVPTSGKEAGQ